MLENEMGKSLGGTLVAAVAMGAYRKPQKWKKEK